MSDEAKLGGPVTPEMIEAGWRAYWKSGLATEREKLVAVYRAMSDAKCAVGLHEEFPTERKPGFYWVKIEYGGAAGADWEIARWWLEGWARCSTPGGYSSIMLDKIIEVDERRIVRDPP